MFFLDNRSINADGCPGLSLYGVGTGSKERFYPQVLFNPIRQQSIFCQNRSVTCYLSPYNFYLTQGVKQ